MQPRSEPSSAILTVPNVLTFIRLAFTPLFLWFALGERNMALAFSFAVLGTVTDLADGAIARRYGQITKLGIALDPLADRLAIASAVVVLIVHDLAPLPAVLAIVARDVLLVVIGVPLLRVRGIPIPPVSKIGKWGAFTVSIAVAVLLGSAIPGIDDPNEVARAAGLVVLAIGLPLYWAAGLGYIRAGLSGLRAQPRGKIRQTRR